MVWALQYRASRADSPTPQVRAATGHRKTRLAGGDAQHETGDGSDGVATFGIAEPAVPTQRGNLLGPGFVSATCRK